jgi:hypothetical protein
MLTIPDNAEDRDGWPLWSEPLPPRTGWVSPDGRFSECGWMGHARQAWEITSAMGLDHGQVREQSAHAHLLWHGWARAVRLNRSGGFKFAIVTDGRSLTPAQAAVEAAWMEINAIDFADD